MSRKSNGSLPSGSSGTKLSCGYSKNCFRSRRSQPAVFAVMIPDCVIAPLEVTVRLPDTTEVPSDPADVEVIVRKLLSEARARTTMADVGG